MSVKVLFFGIFLAVFAAAANAEESKELTTRQFLLLAVPDGAEVMVGNIIWTVDNKTHLETLTVVRRDVIDVIEVLGLKVFQFVRIAIIPKPTGGFGFLPTIMGVADESGDFQIAAMSDLYSEFVKDERAAEGMKKDIGDLANGAISALGIATDQELSEFISKHFNKKGYAL